MTKWAEKTQTAVLLPNLAFALLRSSSLVGLACMRYGDASTKLGHRLLVLVAARPKICIFRNASGPPLNITGTSAPDRVQLPYHLQKALASEE